jgi:hypothetical protein
MKGKERKRYLGAKSSESEEAFSLGGIVHSRLLGTDSAPTLFNFSPPTSLWTHPSWELVSDLMLLLVGGVRVMYNGRDLIGYQAGPLYRQAWWGEMLFVWWSWWVLQVERACSLT